jgi:phosphatidylinositol alpha 1,6-mannosyltransferase
LTIRKIEQEILAQGHHVCILTTKSGNPDNTNMDGIHPNRTVLFLDNALPLPFLNDPNHPETSYQLGFSLSESVKELVDAFEPSLIHVTVPDSTCLHLITYARSKEIPLMGTYHSNIPEYMGHYPYLGWLKFILHGFFRHQYNFLQALYVPTPFIHKHLTDTCSMDKVTNLQVWGRGIDLETFSPSHRSLKFREKLGFDEHDVVVCWVGRLVPEKRPDIFGEVIRRLHERNIPFKALVIGAGPCEEDIKALPNTTFTGWMQGDDLAIAYASSDIFLFPSAVETFGNVTLEAAASGLPLVVEQGCSGHLVKHGINGFACHEHDVDAFFDSTLCLILDDLRRRQFSQESRSLSLNFEKRAVCRQMLENYSKVTDEFYCDYGGRHANRDAVYMNKAGSFVGGNHPRPTLLVLVERLFVVLFLVMYQMASAFLYVRESFLVVPGAAANTSSTTTASAEQHEPEPTLQVLLQQQSSPQELGTTTKAAPGGGAHLGSITELEECDYEGSEQDLQDIQVGALFCDDNETETTVSHDSDDSASAARKNQSWCRRPPSPGEFQLSHALSKGFVHCMFFQFRMESQLRNRINHLCTPSSWNSMKRKRKNSSMVMETLSDIERKRSDDSDSLSDDSLERLVNNTGSTSNDRASMRARGSQLMLVEMV